MPLTDNESGGVSLVYADLKHVEKEYKRYCRGGRCLLNRYGSVLECGVTTQLEVECNRMCYTKIYSGFIRLALMLKKLDVVKSM